MPRPASTDQLGKFLRYRALRQARGMKLLRIWVPDTSAPGFAAEAARQAGLLRGASEEAEALDYIEQFDDFDSIAE